MKGRSIVALTVLALSAVVSATQVDTTAEPANAAIVQEQEAAAAPASVSGWQSALRDWAARIVTLSAPLTPSTTSLEKAASLAVTTTAVGKRGLAVPWNAVGADINKVPTGKITWMYNWETYLPPGGKQFEFVAMLRTGSADDLNRMNWNLAGSGAKVLLCLNEPDIASQANLSVDAAVKIWHEVCWPRRQALKLKLGAPAISNGPQGLPWLKAFLAKVSATHPPDFAPIHWYGVSSSDFINHVKQVNAATKLPIWVTEFASQQTTVAQQKTFMSTVLAFLDSASYVQRYSWFLYARSTNVGDASRLMTADGSWTDLMRLYLS